MENGLFQETTLDVWVKGRFVDFGSVRELNGHEIRAVHKGPTANAFQTGREHYGHERRAARKGPIVNASQTGRELDGHERRTF